MRLRNKRTGEVKEVTPHEYVAMAEEYAYELQKTDPLAADRFRWEIEEYCKREKISYE